MKTMIMIGSLAANIVQACKYHITDINAGCCQYFTEINFEGQVLQRCQDDWWQALPEEF